MKYIFTLVAAIMFVAPAANAADYNEAEREIFVLSAKVAMLQNALSSVNVAGAATAGIEVPLTITVVDSGKFIFDTVASEAEARETCGYVAYNENYMFDRVICTLGNKEIYNRILVAG